MCGSGSVAQTPKRPGWSVSIFLAYSLNSRAILTATSLPSGVTCGVVGEVIEVATPPLSMSSRSFCTDQFFSGKSLRPITSIAANQVGGTMWQCTSMRCGLACAKTLGAKPAAAATPAAAAPATNCRRLMPVAENGWMQQLQEFVSEAAKLRPFHLSMMSSRFPRLCGRWRIGYVRALPGRGQAMKRLRPS